MDEQIVLYSKEGFDFIKNKKNNYSLFFNIENKNIIMERIIDFTLIKLIYDLNSDIYEKVNIKTIDENNVKATLLMKHLFNDLGLPQRYSFINITKIVESNKISFVSKSIRDESPEGMPIEAEQMPIKNMDCQCNILTPHKIKFSCNVSFEEKMNVPPFAEKMVGLILFKIFSRVKQFIENVRM
jgi:hypothetical protein